MRYLSELNGLCSKLAGNGDTDNDGTPRVSKGELDRLLSDPNR